MNLSIIIITKNEEENIRRTLESLNSLYNNNLKTEEWQNEIVIIDSGSTDRTLEIAKEYTEKIFHNDWTGYTAQRNFGTSKSTGDWILFLDADEVLTESLALEIREICLQNHTGNVYQLKRKSFYLGRLLNYSWQPDLQLRLISKSMNPLWTGKFVHEKLTFNAQKQEFKILTLNNFFIHYSYKNIQHHFDKSLKYAKLSAEEYFHKGKSFKYKNLIFNPLFAFFKFYLLRRGFLDGFPGLLAGMSSAYYTFMKYAFLKEMK